MNLSKSTISLRKQEMTECSNESTDYNLSVYRYVMRRIFLIRFLLAFLKCIGKQLLSDLHKSFAISIRILLRRRTFMIIFFPRGLGEPPKFIQFLLSSQASEWVMIKTWQGGFFKIQKLPHFKSVCPVQDLNSDIRLQSFSLINSKFATLLYSAEWIDFVRLFPVDLILTVPLLLQQT